MREVIGPGKGYELIGSEFTYLLLFVNFKEFFRSPFGFRAILKSYASLTLSFTGCNITRLSGLLNGTNQHNIFWALPCPGESYIQHS